MWLSDMLHKREKKRKRKKKDIKLNHFTQIFHSHFTKTAREEGEICGSDQAGIVVQLNRSQSVTLAALKTGLGLAAAISASRDTRVEANASDLWWSSRQRSPTSPVSCSRTTATGMNLVPETPCGLQQKLRLAITDTIIYSLGHC
jgi:hypothetical protein